jgi:glycerol-3-phosphate acyltransferase PlsY
MLIAVLVFAATVAWSRMVSAGSCLGALALAISVYALPHRWATAPTHMLPPGWTLPIIATLVAALILVKHRANIQRIFKGEENRI